MKYTYFNIPDVVPTTALLIKDSSFVVDTLYRNYGITLNNQGISLCAFSLFYETPKKCSAVRAKEYLIEELLPVLDKAGITTLLVADAIYFKYLVGIAKVTGATGYTYFCVIKGYDHIKCILAPNYQAILYNPNLQAQLDTALNTLVSELTGSYVEPGKDIIKFAEYPKNISEIATLLKYSILTCDIETRGLKFYNCGISTIAFAWNEHEGMAFPIDRACEIQINRKYLKRFFQEYTGQLIFHKANFDIKVLIYNLWMKDLSDYKGLIDGLNVFKDHIQDTKLIAYLALNNTVQTKLGLKILAAEFAGNYGQENIEDTDKIDLPELLEYNLKDCLCTWYVYNKYYPQMVADKQEPIYKDIMLPAVTNVLQMELCGMPIDMAEVKKLKTFLENEIKSHNTYFQNSNIISTFHTEQLYFKAEVATAKAKKKIYSIDDPVIAFDFNPNSDQQLQKLIYTYLEYTPFDFTKSKAPATGTKTLAKLINHATCNEHKEIFQHLIDHALADKILSGFIPAFLQAQQLPDSSYRLYGNFTLGGTKSGRLSSSQINLQNLPSNSIYGKAVKKCFTSPPGWLFVGSDFTALESIINALITKDPNKLMVFTDGFDSHCLASYFYFQEKILDITTELQGYFTAPIITKEKAVSIINSIKTRYPTLRQESKAVSFAAQYGGNHITFHQNSGFPLEEAKLIEQRYHELYAVSDQWVKNKLDKAHTTGYVTCAFGLRLRTPILKQTVLGVSMPFIAQKERRSAGNAVSGQAYGLLTTRAGIAFQRLCMESQYKYDILPVAHIHDAIYLLVKDNPDIVKWVNDKLIECMAWQELPELKHDKIKISSELEIYWPNWSNPINVKNHTSISKLKEIAKKSKGAGDVL